MNETWLTMRLKESLFECWGADSIATTDVAWPKEFATLIVWPIEGGREGEREKESHMMESRESRTIHRPTPT